MTDLFTKEIKITSGMSDSGGIMKASSLFTAIHDIADEHLEGSGCGKETLLRRGLMWVIANQTATIGRMPYAGEAVTVRTWLGPRKIMFYPRYYEIISSGEVIVSASAVWALMSSETREIYRPGRNEYIFPASGLSNGEDPFAKLSAADTPGEYVFTVGEAHLDINRHMNNARYFDEFDRFIPAAMDGLQPKRIIARYCHEALPGERIICSWGTVPDLPDQCPSDRRTYYISCSTNDDDHLKANITY